MEIRKELINSMLERHLLEFAIINANDREKIYIQENTIIQILAWLQNDEKYQMSNYEAKNFAKKILKEIYDFQNKVVYQKR